MHLKTIGAAILWTTAVGLALTRTFAEVEEVTVWCILAASVAAVLSVWAGVDWVVARAARRVTQEVAETGEHNTRRVAREIAEAMEDDAPTRLPRRH